MFKYWNCPLLASTVTAPDVALGRNAAGVVEINNGSAGTYRDLKLRALTATGQSLTGSEATGLIDLATTWNTSGTPTAIEAAPTEKFVPGALTSVIGVAAVTTCAVTKLDDEAACGARAHAHQPRAHGGDLRAAPAAVRVPADARHCGIGPDLHLRVAGKLSAGVAVNWEWQRLIGGERLEVRYGAGGATVAAAAALGHLSLPLYAFLVILAGAIGVAALADAPRRLWAGAGVLYASALVFSVCVLRTSEPYGLAAIAMLFAIVWGTDIFAYFGGRLIGGPKLWPAVSAGKTWSGTLTGVFSGAALGLAAARMGTTRLIDNIAVEPNA